MTSVMRLVAEERLERAEADDLVGDLLEHPHALGAGEGEALLVDDLAEDLLDLAPDLDLVGQVELRVEVLDHPVLDPELDVPERLADGRLSVESAARRGRGRRRLRRRRRPQRARDGWIPRGAAPPGSSAFDPLQAGTSLTPLRPRTAIAHAAASSPREQRLLLCGLLGVASPAASAGLRRPRPPGRAAGRPGTPVPHDC